METKPDLPKRQSRELAETFAKNWLYEKWTLLEKMSLARKPKPNLPKLFLKTLKPILETWFCQKERKPEKTDFVKWNHLLTKTLPENHEANFGNLSKFDTKLFEPKTWADFRETKTLQTAAAKNADFCEPETLLKTETLICKTQNANLKRNLIFETVRKIERKFLPTVCVTRAGAGGGTPSDWKNAEA